MGKMTMPGIWLSRNWVEKADRKVMNMTNTNSPETPPPSILSKAPESMGWMPRDSSVMAKARGMPMVSR